jgi:prevent-host-death family protein
MTSVPVPDVNVISQRELRNQSAGIMDRLEAGESFTVTRSGRPVGRLLPFAGPSFGVPTDALAAAMAHLPRVDYAKMRQEMDDFFDDDGDRVG